MRITLTIWPEHTVVTVATRDGADNFEWDRRRGTFDVKVSAAALEGPVLQGLVDELVQGIAETV